MATESTPHHPAIAAFVTKHRDTLEDHANADKRTAKRAGKLLSWERKHSRPQEASE